MLETEKRVCELAYKHGASHLSSCLNSVDIIDRIYQVKKKEDAFVLGNAHAALALYVILEKYGEANAEELLREHGIHATRDPKNGIWVSGGSLGQAETVAVGLAIAAPEHNVYLVTSDGACAEGAIWEALTIARNLRIENLRITVVANGYSAYGKVDVEDLDARLNAFYPSLVLRPNLFDWPDWLQGVAGHYVVMSKNQYEEVMGERKND